MEVSLFDKCMSNSSRWASGCSEKGGCQVFDVLVLRPWPLTPTEGHLWHATGRVLAVGHAGVKLSPPWLYCLGEFREGALTWLSQRVQSVICDRQGPSASQRPALWSLTIRALGIAADVYKHAGHSKAVALNCKESVNTYCTVVQGLQGLVRRVYGPVVYVCQGLPLFERLWSSSPTFTN